MLSSPETIKCIAFDLGGVLVDVDRSPLKSLCPSQKALTKAFFLQNDHRALSTGRLSEDDYFTGVAKALGEELQKVKMAWAKMVKSRNFANKLLDSLTVPYVIWSNTDPLHFRTLNKELALSKKVLGHSVLSFKDGCLKPDPAFFHGGIEKSGFRAHEIVFFDDKIENVQSASKCGVNAYCVSKEILLYQFLASLN